jgi:hypothetical protein
LGEAPGAVHAATGSPATLTGGRRPLVGCRGW